MCNVPLNIVIKTTTLIILNVYDLMAFEVPYKQCESCYCVLMPKYL